MSWLYSQALVAEYLAESSLDGAPFAPLSGMPTPQAYCAPVRMTAYSRLSRFGMTCAPLTEDRGAELLTWYLADSHAKTSALPEIEPELLESEVGYGGKWRELSVKFDPVLCGWKTVRCLWEEVLDWSCLTLPRWGSMHAGELWELTTSVLHTIGNGFGLEEATYPTPNTLDSTGTGRMNTNANVKKWGGINSLGGMAATGKWPTPTMQDAENNGSQSQMKRKTKPLNAEVGGALNPTWVEWLMGWPLGWTDLEPLETDKFPQWLRSHGASWQP